MGKSTRSCNHRRTILVENDERVIVNVIFKGFVPLKQQIVPSIKANNETSEAKLINAAEQGLVLGPLLFTMHGGHSKS